jgi:hypothetical protein
MQALIYMCVDGFEPTVSVDEGPLKLALRFNISSLLLTQTKEK